nr:beta-1,3-galactosyltransferase 7 [Quercus suber]
MKVSVKHAGVREGKNNGLESYSLNIDESSAVRDDIVGEFDYKEDDGVQHSLNSHGENDGCVKALCDIDAGQRPYDGDVEAGVQMTKTEEELEKNQLVEINPGLLAKVTCISINKSILQKYASEDVSLGSQFTSLEVEHIDEHVLM